MMKKRIMTLVATFLCSLSFLGAGGEAAVAMTADQQNIVHWADLYYDAIWTPQETVPGWRGKYTFYKGETYRLPYGQPVEAGEYIGYGVGLDAFLRAADDAESVFYVGRSEYADKFSTFYATDCSGFVSACWGVPRNTTLTLGEISEYQGMANLNNIRVNLQVGDAINSTTRRHVVLVTDLKYDEVGNLRGIEITEQIPPQLRRTTYTPEELAGKYGLDYGIYRYNGNVPIAPESDYLSLCEITLQSGQVRLKVNSGLMTLPCETAICAKSELLALAKTDEIYAVTGVCRNTEQELWYQVRTETGEVGYLIGHAAKISEIGSL